MISKFNSQLIFLLFIFLIESSCTIKKKSFETITPNVVIVLVDDMAYGDLSCYSKNAVVKTPNIDALLSQGLKLESYYVNQAVCTASRAALLTGCYSNRLGIHQAYMPQSKIGLHPDEMTMAEMLQTRGYKTGIFGKWHLGDHPSFMPNSQGFDEYFGIPYSNDMWSKHPEQGSVFNFGTLPLMHNTDTLSILDDQSELTKEITKRSIKFIKDNHKKPFFLYVAHPQPHVPLYKSEMHKQSKSGLYGDVIKELDESVGSIILELKNNNLWENTIFVFTSDNGPWLAYGNHAGNTAGLREGKGTSWEGGVRVPCIISYPNKIKERKLIEIPIMNIDLLPTIAHYTQSSLPPRSIDGKNISNILEGKRNELMHNAYFFYYNVNELQGLRMGDWKLMLPHKYRSLHNEDIGHNGKPGKYHVKTIEKPELYNLKKDKNETNNIASTHPEIVGRMQVLADSMRTILGDSLQHVKGRENRSVGKVK